MADSTRAAVHLLAAIQTLDLSRSEPREDGDAILSGSVNTYQAFLTTTDPANQRALTVQIIVTLSITRTERATNKTIYSRPSFSFNQRYEISSKPDSYFEESDPALDRLSREVALSLVSGFLKAFDNALSNSMGKPLVRPVRLEEV